MESVKLAAITTPTIAGIGSAEQFVAYAARVSNPSNQLNNETAPKLLKYLIKNKHWSPFEMVHIVMEIVTTRDIGRQILRHRSFSFQEFSQRYAVSKHFALSEARLQDAKNRQASIETQDAILQLNWRELQVEVIEAAEQAYDWAINNGIAKEVARKVLPEGLTMSTMYMAGTLRSWIHYIDIRTDPSTQKEHRLIAEQCKECILKEFPSLSEYFNENSK